ncbi:MAG: hypothetical protein GC160_28540 [Acidobacteria bacterium]|nr:hypothetical protein [Acidobacteriota bacterium]
MAWTAIAAGLLMACESNPPGSADNAGRQSEAAESIESARRQARDEIKQQLDALDRQIAELKQKASEAGGEAKQEWNQSVDQLQGQTQELQRELDSMADQGQDAWDRFAARARQTMDQIKSGVKDAADDLG